MSLYKYRLLPALAFIIMVVAGCGSSTNKEKIVGTWESVIDDKDLEMQVEGLRPLNMKIVLTFNADLSLKSEMVRMQETTDVYFATYEFDADQKRLLVYREGKKDRKNVAEIVKLTRQELTLVDESGSGDTLNLKKIK